MVIADSARKHGVSDEDIRHAVRYQVAGLPQHLTDRVGFIGVDTTGRHLEIVVLDPEDDPVVIHAMVLRRAFYRYL